MLRKAEDKASGGGASGRSRMVFGIAAWHVVGSAGCSRSQSACQECAAESPAHNSIAASRACKLVVVTDGVSGGCGCPSRGVSTGSERSRSDGMGPFRTGEAVAAGTTTAAGASCDRRTHGGVGTGQTGGRGTPPGPKPNSTASGAVPVAVYVRRCARVRCGPKAVGQSGAPECQG